MTLSPSNRSASVPRVAPAEIPPRPAGLPARCRDGGAVLRARPVLAARRGHSAVRAAIDGAVRRGLYRHRGDGFSGDRALSRHLALRLAPGFVQYRPRGDPDRADLFAGHVRADPAGDVAALDVSDRLAGADRAARGAAPRLPPVQGSRLRSRYRARSGPERA